MEQLSVRPQLHNVAGRLRVSRRRKPITWICPISLSKRWMLMLQCHLKNADSSRPPPLNFSGRGAAGVLKHCSFRLTHHLPSTLRSACHLRSQHTSPVSGANPRILPQLPHAPRFLLRVSQPCKYRGTLYLYIHSLLHSMVHSRRGATLRRIS